MKNFLSKRGKVTIDKPTIDELAREILPEDFFEITAQFTYQDFDHELTFRNKPYVIDDSTCAMGVYFGNGRFQIGDDYSGKLVLKEPNVKLVQEQKEREERRVKDLKWRYDHDKYSGLYDLIEFQLMSSPKVLNEFKQRMGSDETWLLHNDTGIYARAAGIISDIVPRLSDSGVCIVPGKYIWGCLDKDIDDNRANFSQQQVLSYLKELESREDISNLLLKEISFDWVPKKSYLTLPESLRERSRFTEHRF